MYILGISCHYHEAAAALIKDGRIVAAAEEERFSRKKHDASFPKQAIAFCLETAGVRAADLTYVVFYERPFRTFERNLTMSANFAPWSGSFFVDSMRNGLTEKLWIKSTIAKELDVAYDSILFVPQHLSHAAASYYPSPYSHAAYLTLDAVGEWTTGSMGTARHHTLYPMAEMRFPHSVGYLYSAFTAYLGFEVNDGEYKVMGMAGFGTPKHVHVIRRMFTQHGDGSLSLDLSYFAYHRSSRAMYTKRFEAALEGYDRFDIAASIQKVTEEIILRMMTLLAQKTGETNLVYGGGVALNSVINGLITKRTPFKHVFIFPAAGDDGAAVGAALYVYHHVLNHKKRTPMGDVFWGIGFTTKEIQRYLDDNHIRYQKMQDKKLCEYVADALIDGKVVGWFEGRAEFGPRALGHRTILADPKDPDMKDRVNAMIKFREEFRPFAPVVLKKFVRKYFDVTEPNFMPYMLGTFEATSITKKIAAATTHVDGTSRIQSVDRTYDGMYQKLLTAFHKKTKRPILLNTSFNLKGEPIVNSPADAYSTFIRSGIDVLVLGKYVILK